MTGIRARDTYAIKPRTQHKTAQKALAGFAVDITVRFNTDGHAFLEDHNNKDGLMSFSRIDRLEEFISKEISRNFIEHFGRTP